MKKIFLTSGLVLCMACPAYATASFDAATTGTQDGDCIQSELGVYSGDTTLKAIWSPNKGTVNLNNGSSYTQQNCTTNQTINHTSSDDDWLTVFTASDPTGPLKTTYGLAVYPDATTQDADTDNDGTGGITALTSSPALTGYIFQGYYSAATGGTKYINGVPGASDSFDNGDFVLESTNDQSDPRYGHALLDQYVSASGGTGNLYAHWTPKTYTITYACGSAGDNAVTRVNNAPDTTVTYDDCYDLETVASQCGATEPTGYTFGGWKCEKVTTPVSGDPTTSAFTLPGANAFKTLPASSANNDLLGYPSGTTATSLYEETTSGNSTVTAGGVWTTDLADNESVRCTAIWRANRITVTWDDDNATTPAVTTNATGTCTYESDVVLPTTPAKTGYTFGGWEVVHPTPEECAANPSTEGCPQPSGGNNNG